MTDKILQGIEDTKGMYYRLILLVGNQEEFKPLAETLTKEMDVTAVNVNLELSRQLLHKTSRQRKLGLAKAMQEIIGESEPVLLKHIDILFDVDLGQDPLRLLESLSRNKTVVALWNAHIDDGKLVYAEPGHPEYRSYNTKDLIVIDLSTETH